MALRNILLDNRRKLNDIESAVGRVLLNLNSITNLGFRFLEEVFEEARVGKDIEVAVLWKLQHCDSVEIVEAGDKKIIRITKTGEKFARAYKN